MPKRPMPRSIDEYISGSSPEVQPLLKKIRKTIREAAPQAEETISYGMPAPKQRGVLVYFAAFKNHIGLYPPPQPANDFGDSARIGTIVARTGINVRLRAVDLIPRMSVFGGFETVA